MARRNSSLGFFGIFGRSEDLRSLDRALHAVDLHPALVPEGVKLTIVNLMKDRWPDTDPPADSYLPLAGLFAYCIAGPEMFRRANGEERLDDVEQRIEEALEDGGSLDAQLVLLAMHSGLINPDVVARFGLETGDG